MVDLIDIVLEGFKQVISWVTSQFIKELEVGYSALTQSLFGTPTPTTDGNFVFGAPTSEPWISIHDGLVGGDVLFISLLLLIVSVQARHLLRIFHISSTYGARKTAKTAWTGAVLIICWYWIAVLTLYLVDGFTIALLPQLESIGKALIRMTATSLTSPIFGLIFAAIGGLSMWTLQALLYLRELLLYVYLYAMPIAFALSYGNVPILADIATGFSRRFVPLAVLPLPAAVVLKGYDLLYQTGALNPPTVFFKHLVATSLPLIALYVTWKTFKYASPLTARVIGTATQTAVTVGAVATGAYVAGGSVATTAARWGPRAAAGQAFAQRATAYAQPTTESPNQPPYRRTENDPDPTYH
ncbi:hypothetical protein SAMN04487950_0484 [Halogranum rubrum]|uniref:Type IV secretion system protein TrbL n=1 Tax=Halogranum rubrum TaxID=553466 RepID=A0A1I4BD36_9EURY|nr:hypothetical protein [Halogranum rubrum]SFK66722.1 hypothetical protein SAMN04487950_0484 [Halogranum rubrum]